MFKGPEIYWHDCMIVIIGLIVSVLIGIYFGIFDKRQTTTEYLMGNRRMKPFPVGCSVIASFVSSVSLISLPPDVYLFGAAMLLIVVIMTLECLISCTVFLPVLYKLKIKSIYEYLNQRFDGKTRNFIALLFILSNFLYISCVIYLTIIILSPAIGISFHTLVPIISGICIFYTTVGGFKTVIWTDTVQLLFIFASLISVLILGTTSSEYDLKTIWKKAIEGDRLNVFDFDFDLTKRNTFWTLVIGFTLQMVGMSTISQNHMQKILAVQTFRESMIAKIYYAIGITVIYTLCSFMGILMYAKYSNCDPVQGKKILANDQLVLFYATQVAQNIPGFIGLFLAGTVNAALSTQSSVLNSMAGVIHEDFLKELMDRNMSEKRRHIILRLIVLVLGIASTLFIYVIIHLKTSIFAFSLSLNGILSGTALGVFTLGILFPRANAKGALYGSFCGCLVAGFIVIPAVYYQYSGFWQYPYKPLSINNCTFANDTEIYEVRAKSDFGLSNFQPPAIFRISFYYYTAIGSIATLVSGLVISYFTNGKNDPPIEKSLLSPLVKYFYSKNNSNVNENVTYSSIEGGLILDSNIISTENDEAFPCK